ncbi:MAG: isoprenylcysteine carboxyl methyltransferase family protein [Ornithinimicrobium sp.]
MGSVSWYVVLIALVVLERLAELVLSKKHASWAFDHGGVEYGRGHYPPMVVLHTGLLVGCLLEVFSADRQFNPALGWSMVVVVLAAQGLRWWCILTLGRQWNTRVIVTPGIPLVHRGPYRWIPHPNYVAVIAEGIALPLVHSAWITAAVFTVLNAWLLVVRIRTENAALDTVR